MQRVLVDPATAGAGNAAPEAHEVWEGRSPLPAALLLELERERRSAALHIIRNDLAVIGCTAWLLGARGKQRRRLRLSQVVDRLDRIQRAVKEIAARLSDLDEP